MSQTSDPFSTDPLELDLSDPGRTGVNDFLHFLESLPLAAFFIGADRKLIFANTAARRVTSRKIGDLKVQNIDDIIRLKKPLGWDETAVRVSAAAEVRGDCELIRNKGESVYGEIFVRPAVAGGWLVIFNDLSARRQAETEFLASERQRWQAQKTEALERLAGGIAHDFNNFLAVILLHTDMLNLQLADDSPLLHRVNEIKAVSNDAAGIVRQLLAFGRKQPMSPAPVVLNKAIQDSARVFNALVGEKVSAELGLAADLGVCFVDQNQIAQALMFLAVNARDAMPDGGTLKIETANIVLDRTQTHKSQPGGSYIEIAVTDSGIGMDSKTEEHIFEPFFSTKGPDKAAGLGLATVYGIVKQSGGFIWVDSEKNRGTTFKMQFPRIDQPEMMTAASDPVYISVTGDETILLVDDEPSVRRVAAEILRKAGYKVLEANSGTEAIEIAGSFPAKIDMILTDFSMPKMNGTETARKIIELYPDASILYMSGNVTDIDHELKGPLENAEFLGKPFSSSTLTLKVREVLDNSTRR